MNILRGAICAFAALAVVGALLYAPELAASGLFSLALFSAESENILTIPFFSSYLDYNSSADNISPLISLGDGILLNMLSSPEKPATLLLGYSDSEKPNGRGLSSAVLHVSAMSAPATSLSVSVVGEDSAQTACQGLPLQPGELSEISCDISPYVSMDADSIFLSLRFVSAEGLSDVSVDSVSLSLAYSPQGRAQENARHENPPDPNTSPDANTPGFLDLNTTRNEIPPGEFSHRQQGRMQSPPFSGQVNPSFSVRNRSGTGERELVVRDRETGNEISRARGRAPHDINAGIYDAELELGGIFGRAQFMDLVLDGNTATVAIDTVSDGNTISEIGGMEVVRQFYIDPYDLNFGTMTITLTAEGQGLFKCADWNSTEELCHGDWEKIADLTAGQDYNIVITPGDPGFAETSIDILTVQSYPEVGGYWAVDFNTTGTADLAVQGWEDTNFNDDLEFYGLACGTAPLSPQVSENSVTYQNYSCDENSHFVSHVLTQGRHVLRFDFGDETEYAYNSATAPDINLTHIDGYVDNNGEYNLPEYFSYFNDGNLAIRFLVHDAERDDLNFNMWYSSSAGAKETKIISDLNLGTAQCDSADWAIPAYCTYDWNANPWITPDGNYYIDVVLDDGTSTDANSSSTFKVSPCPRANWNLDYNVTMYGADCNVNSDVTSGSVGVINIAKNWITLDCNGLDLNGNDLNYGIYNNGRDSVTIKNCNLRNYYLPMNFGATAVSNTIMDNNIYSSQVSTNSRGMNIASMQNSQIIRNDINGGAYGIFFGNSSTDNNIALNHTDVNPNGMGIYFYKSGAIRNNAEDNNCSSGLYGIAIYSEGLNGDSNFSGNITTDNTSYGIFIKASKGNTVRDNNASGNDSGIYLNLLANGNNILDNNIWNNTSYGIDIAADSNQNLIYNNWISGNGTNAQDLNGFNDWNTSKTLATNIIGGPYLGGNYWSDYAGTDTDSDGIGNTTYSFTTGYDYLPLVDANYYLTCPGDNIVITENTVFMGLDCNVNDDLNDGVIIIGADNITLGCNGLDLNGDGTGFGIYNNGYDNVTIRNCSFSGYEDGIRWYNNANYGSLEDINAAACGTGINLYSSSDNNVLRAFITGATTTGVWIRTGANRNSVRDSNISNSANGVETFSGCHDNNITGCGLSGNTYGVWFRGTDTGLVKDNNISGSLNGVIINTSGAQNVVRDNNLVNNTNGISITPGTDNNIFDNNILNNTNQGVYVTGASTNNRIYGNSISNTANYGIYLYNGASSNLVQDNNTSNNGNGIRAELNSNDNNILSNIANDNTTYGVFLYNLANRNLVQDNNASGNQYGITAYNDANSNIVKGNLSTANTSYGFYIRNCGDNNFYGNTSANNTSFGMYLFSGANSNLVQDNNASGNQYGIYLRGSNDNNILSNIANDNTTSGIYVYDSSNRNLFKDNNASGNDSGIYLNLLAKDNNILDNNIWNNTSYGIDIAADSNQNLIYNNWISGNGTNAQDLNGFNDFNTTKTLATNIIGGAYKGGNYWGDYTGVDSDGDGIGQSVYSFTTGFDYLPLTNSLNYTPDINITHIDGNVDNNSGYNLYNYYSYFNDGNLTIRFQVYDPEQNDLNFNMWYSTSAGAKANKIVSDLNLTTKYCDTNNFDVPTYCTYDWNANPWQVADGNYFIDVVLNDGTSTDANSSSTFKVSPCPRDTYFVDTNVTMYGADCNAVDVGADGVIRIAQNWITLDCNGLDLNANDKNYGIFAQYVQHVTIKNCSVRNYSVGINFDNGTSYSLMQDNNVDGCASTAINVQNNTDSNILGNIATDSAFGIRVGNACSGILVSDNNVSGSATAGLDLAAAAVLTTCSDNNLIGNAIGIQLRTRAKYSTISDNNISGSTTRGIDISIDSNANLFYNNWISNTDNVRDLNGFNDYNSQKDCTATNIIGGACKGGNYWNVYAGTDTDGDGIGNSIYALDANVIDRLPLTNSLNYAPDINLTHIDANVDNNSGYSLYNYYSYFNDGNLAIRFLVHDAERDDLNFNMWYSTSAGAKETAIIQDLNLGTAQCDSADWAIPTYCTYDWNANPWITPDGNYFIDVVLDDGTSTDSNSTSTFKVSPCPRDTLVLGESTTFYGYDCNLADLNGSDGSIVIAANNITLDCNGLDINGAGAGLGIYDPDGYDNEVVRNCSVRNYQYGVRLTASDNSVVRDSNAYGCTATGITFYNTTDSNSISNLLVGNAYGVMLVYSATQRNIVRDSNFVDNTSAGVYVSGGDDNNILSNTFFGNAIGVYLYTNALRSLIQDNNVNGGTTGMYIYNDANSNTITGNTIAFNTSNGIYLRNCGDNNVYGNTSANNSNYGIYLYSSANSNLIQDNNVTGNTSHGIRAENNCSDNNIVSNTIIGNSYGIIVNTNSNRNLIRDNNCEGNVAGISAQSGTGNIISGNSATGNTNYGLLLNSGAILSVVNDNNSIGNKYGITVLLLSNDNNVYDNNFWNNSSYGLDIRADCNENLFHNNWISGNGTNAQDLNGFNDYNTSKTMATNIIGGAYKGGNYWGDYTGADSDGDGIGNVVYSFTTGIDHLPLAAVNTFDMNITHIDGNADNNGLALPPFSYVRDGNLTIKFNVYDTNQNDLNFNMWYSLSAGAKGNKIVSDLNLGTAQCGTSGWATTTQCNYDFNIHSSLVTDGNWFIDIDVNNGKAVDSNSSSSFMVDNTKPFTYSTDFNWAGWQAVDANVHFTCSDSNSGCSLMQYRLDTESGSAVSYGAWADFAGIADQNVFINKDGNWAIDFNSTDNAGNMEDTNTIYVLIQTNSAPDINITHIDGYTDNNAEKNIKSYYAYALDGNLTITFTALDRDRDDLNFSMWYSASAGAKENAIVQDLNLTSSYCGSQDWTNTVQCSYDFNISPSLVGDGAYYLDVDLNDGTVVDGNSSSQFAIANTGSVTISDVNSGWQKTDANVTLICVGGCASTAYRVDTDASGAVSYGAWQAYTTGIVFSGDGNFALDYNSTNNAGIIEETNTKYVLVDKTAPSLSITSPSEGDVVGITYTMAYAVADSTSGIGSTYARRGTGLWVANSTATSYLFSFSENGNEVLWARACDKAGGCSDDYVNVFVYSALGEEGISSPGSISTGGGAPSTGGGAGRGPLPDTRELGMPCEVSTQCGSGKCIGGFCGECVADTACPGNRYCSSNHLCLEVACECGSVTDHICTPYECCSNSDCPETYICLGNACRKEISPYLIISAQPAAPLENTPFTVIVRDNKGKAMGGATITAGGKEYTTDKLGRAALSLASGNQRVIASLEGYLNDSRIVRVLEAAMLVVQERANVNEPVPVKVLDSDGNPMPNVEVVVIGGGVSYVLKTNDKGIVYIIPTESGDFLLASKSAALAPATAAFYTNPSGGDELGQFYSQKVVFEVGAIIAFMVALAFFAFVSPFLRKRMGAK